VTHVLVVAAFGILAGMVSGLLGVGGGIVFVPTLTLALGLSQHQAEATSLAAIVPVVAVGSWQQGRAGLVTWHDAIVMGLVSVVGVLGGAQLASSLSDATLKKAFGAFLVLVAVQMAWKARPRPEPAADDG
jgi:uncharacterized membrane protein YfcA